MGILNKNKDEEFHIKIRLKNESRKIFLWKLDNVLIIIL